MNVLGLFDGMSCGQIALNRAGFKIDNYFACEIDKYAIQVTQANYPNTQQLGDVTKVSALDLPALDLVMGGSPCQGFSFAGKQLNFEDPRSKLFFEFVRLLKEARVKNPNVKFLLENVKMKKEYRDIISEHLGVAPIEINSALVSAQNRKRLYWTNLEGVEQPNDKGILLKDIVEEGVDQKLFINPALVINTHTTKNYLQYDMNDTGHKSQSQRASFLNRKSSCLNTRSGTDTKILDAKGRVRRLTRNEGEKLQTVPLNYTASVTRKEALTMLGNGWTVDVIVHILQSDISL